MRSRFSVRSVCADQLLGFLSPFSSLFVREQSGLYFTEPCTCGVSAIDSTSCFPLKVRPTGFVEDHFVEIIRTIETTLADVRIRDAGIRLPRKCVLVFSYRIPYLFCPQPPPILPRFPLILSKLLQVFEWKASIGEPVALSDDLSIHKSSVL